MGNKSFSYRGFEISILSVLASVLIISVGYLYYYLTFYPRLADISVTQSASYSSTEFDIQASSPLFISKFQSELLIVTIKNNSTKNLSLVIKPDIKDFDGNSKADASLLIGDSPQEEIAQKEILLRDLLPGETKKISLWIKVSGKVQVGDEKDFVVLEFVPLSGYYSGKSLEWQIIYPEIWKLEYEKSEDQRLYNNGCVKNHDTNRKTNLCISVNSYGVFAHGAIKNLLLPPWANYLLPFLVFVTIWIIEYFLDLTLENNKPAQAGSEKTGSEKHKFTALRYLVLFIVALVSLYVSASAIDYGIFSTSNNTVQQNQIDSDYPILWVLGIAIVALGILKALEKIVGQDFKLISNGRKSFANFILHLIDANINNKISHFLLLLLVGIVVLFQFSSSVLAVFQNIQAGDIFYRTTLFNFVLLAFGLFCVLYVVLSGLRELVSYYEQIAKEKESANIYDDIRQAYTNKDLLELEKLRDKAKNFSVDAYDLVSRKYNLLEIDSQRVCKEILTEIQKGMETQIGAFPKAFEIAIRRMRGYKVFYNPETADELPEFKFGSDLKCNVQERAGGKIIVANCENFAEHVVKTYFLESLKSIENNFSVQEKIEKIKNLLGNEKIKDLDKTVKADIFDTLTVYLEEIVDGSTIPFEDKMKLINECWQIPSLSEEDRKKIKDLESKLPKPPKVRSTQKPGSKPKDTSSEPEKLIEGNAEPLSQPQKNGNHETTDFSKNQDTGSPSSPATLVDGIG